MHTRIRPVITIVFLLATSLLVDRSISLFRGACALEITSNRLDQLSTRYFDESTAVDRKYPLRCKFHGGVSSGTNGVGPATGEFRIRWTRIIEKRIQVYDIWTMLGRILTVRYTCVSGIRMIHSTREFPRGPRGMFNFSSPLGTNFSAFSCSMHAPNLNSYQATRVRRERLACTTNEDNIAISEIRLITN